MSVRRSAGRASRGGVAASRMRTARQNAWKVVTGKDRVAAPQARRDPLAQIGGRFAREGQNEQLVRPRKLLVDQANGALDDDPRLPRTRAGEDEGGSLAVRDGRRLVLV